MVEIEAMKLFNDPAAFKSWRTQAVVSFGNFDGCHVAHQYLLQALRQEAVRKQLPAVIVCFEPQPQEWFGHRIPRLSSWDEKQRLFATQWIDAVICLPFNQALADCQPEDFVDRILIKMLGMQSLIVGSDVRFGYQRQGGQALLEQLAQRHQFDLQVLPSYDLNNQRVSSTTVRQALAEANFDVVQQLLGRPFTIQGEVIRGQARGRVLGCPTANIALNRLVSPLVGVFAVRAKLPGLAAKPGIANVGNRPTVDGTQWLLEVHLLDFERDCYGQWLEVEFLQKFRDEKKFANMTELANQIEQDVTKVRQYFAAAPVVSEL